MKFYRELGSQFSREVEVFRLVLETECRTPTEDETLLWAAAGSVGTLDLVDATRDLPDTILLSVVPPFPGNSSLVISSSTSSQIIQQRLGAAGWEKASSKKISELRRYLERHHRRYWRSLTPEQQEKIIDREIAEWEAKVRRSKEDERYLASLSPEEREREEKRRDEEKLASMSSQKRREELQRRREIHFGTLRIPMREMVTFIRTGAQYMVASGSGRPEAGGSLLAVPGEGLFSIQSLTRRLMAQEFDEDGDVWALWEYNGETLRSIFERYFP